VTRAPRLLVARRGGLGDALLAAPLLRALRRAHPDAVVAFAGVGEHAALLAALGVADAALSTEDLHAAARAGDRGRWPCDAAWIDDGALAAALPSAARVVAFDPRPRDRRPLPLQLAAACGLALRWPDDAALAQARTAPPTAPLLLAPGSGGRGKCWPRERWLALAAQLAAAGRQLAVLVGPVELERDDPRRWPWPVPLRFLVDLPLPVLAEQLAAAGGFVGNDSGTTHLAAMLGAPTVALFGPTDPAVWAPTGASVCVLGGGEPAAFAAVAEAAAAALQGSCARTRRQ
jgi:heptosyltransferase-3